MIETLDSLEVEGAALRSSNRVRAALEAEAPADAKKAPASKER